MTDPTPPFDCVAIAAYTARNEAEVSLEVGRTYHVLQTDGKGLWWQTRADDGHIGWFPANYTQVQQAAPPEPAPAPVPPVHQQPVHQQPAVQNTPQPQNLSTSTGAPSTTSTPQINNNSQPNPGEKPSAAVKSYEEKTRTNVHVKIQVCEARNLKGQAGKTNPTAFIFRRKVTEDAKGEALFKTQTQKKTVTPKWNEMFTINVVDQEFEIICIRLANGKKFVPKGKEYLGEVEIPLRGAVCDFVSPSYKYKWFPITSKGGASDCSGELLIYAELVDTRQSQGPTNFKHESHIGFSGGEWNVQNIPAAWKNFFKTQGIKRGDLEKNPEMANQVFTLMANATQGGQLDPHAAFAAQNQQQAPHPPEPVKVSGPAPPPPPPVATGPTPPPPPMPGAVKKPPQPPPSRPAGTESSVSEPEPQHIEEEAETEAPSGGGKSFLDQIANSGGKFALRKVDPAAEKKQAAEDSGSLADQLKATMTKYRQDIEGYDNDDDDDWD